MMEAQKRKSPDSGKVEGGKAEQTCTGNFTLTPSSIKAELVRQALEGEISYGPATWLIRQGGLSHA
jgi:hypothetical protein